MPRSFGNQGRMLAAVLGTAVVLGMALAQSPPTPPPSMPPPIPAPLTPPPLPPAADSSADSGTGERFINVGLAGKKHRCKLIVAWDLPKGGNAYQVQTVDTNEMLTLVREANTDGSGEETPVRIFRWGTKTVPPRGAPVAPPVPAPLAIAQTTPTTIPMPPDAAPVAPAATQVAQGPKSNDPWIVGPPAKHTEHRTANTAPQAANQGADGFAAQRPTPKTAPAAGPVVVSTSVPVAPTVPVAPPVVPAVPQVAAAPIAPPIVPAVPQLAPAPIAPPVVPVVPQIAAAPIAPPVVPAVPQVAAAPIAPIQPVPIQAAPIQADQTPIVMAPITPAAPTAQPVPAAMQRIPQPLTSAETPTQNPPAIERIDGVHKVQPIQPSTVIEPTPQGQPVMTPLVPEPVSPFAPVAPVAPVVPASRDNEFQVPTPNLVAPPVPSVQPEPIAPAIEPTPVPGVPAVAVEPKTSTLPLITNGPTVEKNAKTSVPVAPAAPAPSSPAVAVAPTTPTVPATPQLPLTPTATAADTNAQSPWVRPDLQTSRTPGAPLIETGAGKSIKTTVAAAGQEPAKNDPLLPTLPPTEPKKIETSPLPIAPLPIAPSPTLPIDVSPNAAVAGTPVGAPSSSKVISMTEQIVTVPCTTPTCPTVPCDPCAKVDLPCIPGVACTTIPACPSNECSPTPGASPTDLSPIAKSPPTQAANPAHAAAQDPYKWNPAEPYNAFTPARIHTPMQGGPGYANAFGGQSPMPPRGYPMGPMGPYPMMVAGMPMMPGGMPMIPPGAVPYAMTPNGPAPYYQPMPSGYAVAAANPAMDRPTALRPVAGVAGERPVVERAITERPIAERPVIDVPAKLRTLIESAHPSERETAVIALGDVDWRLHQQVVPALNEAAVKDPAPLVRAACVSTLVRLQVPASTIASTLDTLKNDRDIRVRHEVDVARDALSRRP